MYKRQPYVLAPCYAVSGQLEQFEWGEDPLASQNHLMNALMGDDTDYFIKLQKGTEYLENKTTETTTYLITMPYSGPLYAYFPKGTGGESPPETPLSINNEYQLDLYINETDCTLSVSYTHLLAMPASILPRCSGAGRTRAIRRRPS